MGFSGLNSGLDNPIDDEADPRKNKRVRDDNIEDNYILKRKQFLDFQSKPYLYSEWKFWIPERR